MKLLLSTPNKPALIITDNLTLNNLINMLRKKGRSLYILKSNERVEFHEEIIKVA